MIKIDSEIVLAVRQESAQAEKQGKLTRRQLEIIYQQRWFHLLVPNSLDGKEMDLPSFVRLMEELAWIDGSFAWVVNLCAGANMFAGFMEQEAARDIFEAEKACIAGSGAISGKAVKDGEGYRISGYWKYASGSAHATHFSLNAIIEDGEKNTPVRFRSFIVPAREVAVLDTWKVSGLRATASHDFKIENSWVPKHFLFNLQEASSRSSGALYRFPFELLAEVNIVAITIGLAMRFLELIKEVAAEKLVYTKDKVKGGVLHKDISFKKTLIEVEALFLQNRKEFFDSLERCWSLVVRDKQVDRESSTQLSGKVLAVAKSSRCLIDRLYPFMGMNVVFEETEINRVWRDFKVASQHVLLSPYKR